MSEESVLDQATSSLERVQKFDTSSLVREDLGKELQFDGAVEPGKRLIGLFKQLPISILPLMPDDELQKIQKQADATNNRFKEILSFSIAGQAEGNLVHKRDAIISQLVAAYDQNFKVLSPLISYASIQAVDFAKLEEQGRSAIQSIEDRVQTLTEALNDRSSEAEEIVDEIRRIAAEQGVSQQASYFNDEAERNAADSRRWQNVTIGLAVFLSVMAIGSFVLFEHGYLSSDNLYSSLHLILSKILIFGTMTYLLVISARNSLSYKHNETVNRHRLNALLTFQALVKASRAEETHDIVLSHASSCIFTPQPTGYIKNNYSTSAPNGSTFNDMLPRLISSRLSNSTEA